MLCFFLHSGLVRKYCKDKNVSINRSHSEICGLGRTLSRTALGFRAPIVIDLRKVAVINTKSNLNVLALTRVHPKNPVQLITNLHNKKTSSSGYRCFFHFLSLPSGQKGIARVTWTLVILINVEYAWLAASPGKKGEGL
jgi:hypothetical protein